MKLIVRRAKGLLYITGWEHTGHMLCVVNTSLSVLMTFRMCLRELCCLFGIFYCLDLISILPKNQAAPIEMVISDFFRIPKMFIAFVSLCHKSVKAKGKL